MFIPFISAFSALLGGAAGSFFTAKSKDKEIKDKQEKIKSLSVLNDQLKEKNQKRIADLKKMNDALIKELQEVKKQARKFEDPKFYNSESQKVFESFINRLRAYNLTEAIPKIPGQKDHIVMGLISSGKSSLLMKVTGINLDIGVGQTTPKVLKIGQFKNRQQTVNVYDSPGINDEICCYNPQSLMLIKQMDEIFVIYRESLKNVKQLIKIIHALKPEQTIILVRTHCDTFRESDKRTCEEQIEIDRKYMNQLKIPCQIFAFSSLKSMSFKDNEKVAKLIKGMKIEGEQFIHSIKN